MEYIDLTTNQVFGLYELQQRFYMTSNPENITDAELEDIDINSPDYIPRSPHNPIARLETTYPQYDYNFYMQTNEVLDLNVRPVQRTYNIEELPLEQVKGNLKNHASMLYGMDREKSIEYDGIFYDSDDQQRIERLINIMIISGDTDKTVYFKNNMGDYVRLNQTQQQEICMAMRAYHREVFLHYEDLANQVKNATDIPTLQAITIDPYVAPNP